MKVDIYIHTTFTNPRQRNGAGVYVIEAKEAALSEINPLTSSETLTEMSMKKAQAITLLHALERLKGSSEVEINTGSLYIKNMVERLREYSGNGWNGSKGAIKHKEIWERIYKILLNQKTYVINAAPVNALKWNEWAEWLQSEGERVEREIIGQKPDK